MSPKKRNRKGIPLRKTFASWITFSAKNLTTCERTSFEVPVVTVSLLQVAVAVVAVVVVP